jgi:adenylate cyclase
VLLRRDRRHVLVGSACLALLLAGWLSSPGGWRDTLRERSFDLLLPYLSRPAASAPAVVVVDIDRAALARFGPWPWPRERMARLVTAVAAGKPAALALDILFAEPRDGDAELARALSALPSALGFVLEPTGTGEDLRATPILFRAAVALPDVWRAGGAIGPDADLADAAQGMGALVAAADQDGPIRRVPLMVLTGNRARPGLAVEAVRLAEKAEALLVNPDGRLMVGARTLPLGRDGMLRLVRFSAGPVMPAAGLMEDPGTRGPLAGRIVLIGSSAPEAGGLRVTPASPATPTVAIQAAAVEAILRGEVYTRPSWVEFLEPIAAAFLGALGLVIAARLRPATAALVAVLLCLAWTTAAAAAVPGLGALLDPSGPPLVALLAFVLAAIARFARDEWHARLLRLSFEQHLAPEVVRRIAADPAAVRLRGEMREVTALFTDIEDFTGMTERAEPADLVALLDLYFDAATRIVIDHGGMIDKIVGDAIHAIFNAPFALEDHPQRAVASALALIDATEAVRRSPLGLRLCLGRTRVGIETGPAIVGDVGGSRKLDYTAHGNAVNAAARLEAANKVFGSAICIGPGAAARLSPATIRRIGALTLRGQSGETVVYTPVSLTG